MSVDYDSILMVGEAFEDKSSAESFIRSNIKFTEEEECTIEEDGLKEFLYCNKKYGFEIEYTNYYTDDPETIVGFDISTGDPQNTIDNINNAVKMWKGLFSTKPKVISAAKVW